MSPPNDPPRGSVRNPTRVTNPHALEDALDDAGPCTGCGIVDGHREWCDRLEQQWTSDEEREPGPVVTRLDEVEPERVAWLWPGRLPLRKLGVLDGDPGTGKSTIAVDIAARVTTGSPMPDGATLDGPAAVVVLTAEDGLGDTVRPRVEAAGGDASRVYVLRAIRDEDGTERPPRIPDDLAELEALVRRVRARLVIVDVLAAYLSGNVDSYRDADVRRALHPLANVAEATGAVVLVLRHLSKSGGNNAIYRGGGSIGIIGAARVGLIAAIDPEDESRRVLAVTKSNLAAIPPALGYRLVPDDLRGCARVEWLGATAHDASDLLRVDDGEDRSARDEAVEFLTGILADGPVPAREVERQADQAGISKATLRRVKSRLGVRSRKIGAPGEHGEWRWTLPEDAQPTPEDAEDAHPQNVSAFDTFETPDERLRDDGDAVDLLTANLGATVIEASP